MISLKNRKQRVVLNGQVSSWADVNVRVPQGSILGPLLFLIYINDLANYFSSNTKLFADDTFFFSVTHDIFTSADEEVMKKRNTIHPPSFFNNSTGSQTTFQKHVGIMFDGPLTLKEHDSEKN